MKTLKHTSFKFNLKFIIYGLNENARYEFLNYIDENEEKDITVHYLLLICGYDENNNKITHAMYIKDLENFIKLHICPKCGYIPFACDHGCYDKNRFENHVKNCNGKTEKNYI
jgi:hypothetical protein